VAPWNFITGQVGGAVTTRNYTGFLGTTQPGDTLLITLNIASNAMTVSNVTDTAGNTYALDSSFTTTAPQQLNYRSAGATGGPGGGPTASVGPGSTITVTTSATSANAGLSGFCVPGSAWGAVDVIGVEVSGAAVGSLAGSITPTADGELVIFSGVNQSTGGAITVDPPFYGQPTLVAGVGSNVVTWSYRPLGAGTSGVPVTCTEHFGTANNSRLGGWTFLPAGAAAPVALPDAGAADGDVLAVSAAVPVPEAGGAAETLAVQAAVSPADTGAAADALAVSAAVPLPDAAAAADALSASATVNPADAAGAAEALTAAASVPLAAAPA